MWSKKTPQASFLLLRNSKPPRNLHFSCCGKHEKTLRHFVTVTQAETSNGSDQGFGSGRVLAKDPNRPDPLKHAQTRSDPTRPFTNYFWVRPDPTRLDPLGSGSFWILFVWTLPDPTLFGSFWILFQEKGSDPTRPFWILFQKNRSDLVLPFLEGFFSTIKVISRNYL